MKASDLTVMDVLLEHGIEPKRGSIRCPSHDDKNPSCSIIRADSPDGFAHCHTCGWNGDAIGLKAAIEGVSPADVLRSMDRAPRSTATVKPTPLWKLRQNERIRWAVKSQPYFQAVRLALPNWEAELAIKETDEQHLYLNEIFRDEELAPMRLRDIIDTELSKLKHWASFWLDTGEAQDNHQPPSTATNPFL